MEMHSEVLVLQELALVSATNAASAKGQSMVDKLIAFRSVSPVSLHTIAFTI